MADLAKVFNGTGEELKQLEIDAEEAAIAFGSSFEDVTSGMEKWAVEGKKMDDIRIGLLATQRLSIAGDIGESTAAQQLSGIMAGLGGDFKNVLHLVDAANAVGNNFGTTTANIVEGLKQFVGVAKQQGLTLEQMIGLFTGVDVVTKNAGESGNALKTILVRLHDETARSAKAWEMLGLSHKKQNGEFINSFELLQKIAKKWPELTDTQQAYIAKTFGGLFHVSKFNTLMQKMNIVVAAQTAALNSNGSAQKEVTKKLDTSTRAGIRAFEAAKILAKHIGDTQTPELKKYANQLRKTIVAITKWETATKASGTVFNEFLKPAVDSMIASLEVLEKNFPAIVDGVDFDPLKNSLHELSDTLLSMLGIDLSTVAGWSAAIQKAADISTTFIKVLNGIMTVFDGVIDAGGGLLKWFISLDDSTLKSVGKLGAFATLLTIMTVPIGIFARGISSMAGAGKLLWSVLKNVSSWLVLFRGNLALLPAGLGMVITLIYTAVKAWQTYQTVTQTAIKNEQSRKATLAAVNAQLKTNFTTIDEALAKLRAQNQATIDATKAEDAIADSIAAANAEKLKALEASANLSTEMGDLAVEGRIVVTEFDAVKAAMRLRSEVDTTSLDNLIVNLNQSKDELLQTSEVIGAIDTGGAGVASDILLIEQERLTALDGLLGQEQQISTGVGGLAENFGSLNTSQDNLSISINGLGGKIDTLNNRLSEEKDYKVDVQVSNADGAITDLVSRVIEDVIIRMKQENTLAITTG